MNDKKLTTVWYCNYCGAPVTIWQARNGHYIEYHKLFDGQFCYGSGQFVLYELIK